MTRRLVPLVPALAVPLLLCASARAAPVEPEAVSARRADPDDQAVRAQLERIVNTRTARWVEDVWERNGARTREQSFRATWAADHRLRLEVFSGDNAGTVLVRRAERVTVRPPGPFGFMKLRFRFDDSMMRSLRGRTLADVGFVGPLRDALASWDSVQIERTPEGTTLRVPGREGRSLVIELVGRLFGLLRIEMREGAHAVEKHVFRQIELDPPLHDDVFEP